MVEELLKTLIKKYPNHQDLGEALNKVYVLLREREKTPHQGFDRIDERIFVSKIVNKISEGEL